MQYILLVTAWALFGLLHSILAYTGFKQAMLSIMKKNYKYYRALYSLFAIVSLLSVLWFHFNTKSVLLWQNPVVEKAIAAGFSIPAFIVLAMAIKKYFVDLSGMDVFLTRPPASAHLEQTGLHKWVRHPLYAGTILLAWCIFLWMPTASNLISAACITLYTRIGIFYEEKKLIMLFGDQYVDYTMRVPMLVPGL